jgi:hypothetical protein
VGFDLLWVSVRNVAGDPPPALTLEPVGEAGAAYLLPLGRHLYLKLQAAYVLNLQPHDFVLQSPTAESSVFRTARLYLRAGLDLGVSFGKN